MNQRYTQIVCFSIISLLIISISIPTGLADRGRGEKNKPVEARNEQNDFYLEGEDIIAKFEGKTPHAKFFLNKYSESERIFYKIMFKSLVELDPSGKSANPSTHAFTALESQSYNHDVVEESTDNGDRIKTTFSTSINVAGSIVDVIFHFYIYGFDHTSTIAAQDNQQTSTGQSTESNQEEVTVLAASEVKFDVEIHNWPFLSDDNQLELGVRLISIHRLIKTEAEDGEQSSTTTEVDNTEGGKPDGEDEESYMIIPETAIADGEEVEIQRDYRRQGNQDHIFLIFPYFENDLYYDPVLGIGNPNITTNLLFIGAIAAVLVLVALLVIARNKE